MQRTYAFSSDPYYPNMFTSAYRSYGNAPYGTRASHGTGAGSRSRKAYSKMKSQEKTPSLLRKLIRDQLNKEATLKHYRQIPIAYAATSALSAANAPTFLLTNIAKGTDDYNRIGDVIYLKEIKIKGICSVPGFMTSAANLAYVTIIMATCKSAPQATGATLPYTSFLQQNGAYNAWTGTSANRLQDINTDDYEVICRKDFKLTDLVNTTAATAATMVAAGQQDLYFDFVLDHKFKHRKVQYEAGTNQPSTFNPFLAFMITQGDMGSLGVSGQTVNVDAVSNVSYWDTFA